VLTPEEKEARRQVELALADEVIDLIADEGLSAQDACKTAGLKQVYFNAIISKNNDLDANGETFAVRYARARLMRISNHAEQMIGIADRADEQNIKAATLQIETRKWTVGRLLSEYREHTSVDIKAKMSLELGFPDLAIDQRRSALLEAAQAIELSAEQYKRIDQEHYGDVGEPDTTA
jgi:hypothetical protein